MFLASFVICSPPAPAQRSSSAFDIYNEFWAPDTSHPRRNS